MSIKTDWTNLDDDLPDKREVVKIKSENNESFLVVYDPLHGNDFWLVEEPYHPDKNPLNPDDYYDDQMFPIEDYSKYKWKPLQNV